MSEDAHLWQAGLSVPEPLVGPNIKTCTETVPAVLMRVSSMADLLRLGYAHGDYSTYNLLWWENTVTIIDFPQLTTRQNPNFQQLLRRDAEGLSASFRKHGTHESAEGTLREVQRRALGPAPEPRVLLP